MDNLVLIDWLSITSQIHDPYGIVSLLGMDSVSWQTIKGAHGYKDRLYYNCISIHYNGAPDMGVWLEMSGQGCRCFESVGHGDFQFLFDEVSANPGQMKITRLDVAFDDHSGILPIDQIVQDTLAGNYISKATSWECTQSNKGVSIQIGSPQSAVLIRIYDKARERGLTDGSHWVRVEMQFRDDRAAEFIRLPLPIGEKYAAVLVNYLRYVVPDPDDSNNRRWPMTDYWSELVGQAAAISIFSKPGLEYNINRCADYVFRQAGNAVAALITCYGLDGFADKLRKTPRRPNPKYTQIIEDYVRGCHVDERSGEIMDISVSGADHV